jgi:hypothetical protein
MTRLPARPGHFSFAARIAANCELVPHSYLYVGTRIHFVLRPIQRAFSGCLLLRIDAD